MIIFSCLMLAHLLYDFHWQGDFVGIYKSKNQTIMIVHCVTWALLLTLVLLFFKPGCNSSMVFAFLASTHYLIDTWKCSQPDSVKLGSALIKDQLLHTITIIIVVWSEVFLRG